MKLNPLVNFFLFLSLSISTLFSENVFYLNIHSIILLALVLSFKININFLLRSLSKTSYYLFTIFLFYLAFSFLLSDIRPELIIESILLGIYKIVLSILFMKIFILSVRNESFVKLIRSVFLKSRLNIRILDDIILFITLSLRFYPELQNRWKSFERGHIYLGINNNNGSPILRLKLYSDMFIRILSMQYKKSLLISNNIKSRGYGICHPRGIIDPIKINFYDLIISILIPITLIILHLNVKI